MVANDEIDARVEKNGVIAAINASVEEEGGSAVKIIADKVNIEGAAIFTSNGRLSKTSLDNAYDSKGAASTAETNAKNYADGLPSYKVISTTNYHYSTANWLRYSAEGSSWDWTAITGVKVGDMLLVHGINDDTNSDVYCLITVTELTSSGAVKTATSHGLIDPEAGKRADAAQSSVDNLQIGGRNLLIDTDHHLTTLNGSIFGGESRLDAVIPAGEVVTISMDVDADDVVWADTGNKRIGCELNFPKTGSGTQYVGVWAGSAISESMNIAEVLDGSMHKRISKTFTLRGDIPVGRNVNLYMQGVSSGTISIGRVKLERGNKATDWTPAPEDIEANAVKRTQRIYYRKEVTGAPAAPSSWVVNYGEGSDAWTQKHISISSTDKYIYTCEQYEMADGTLGHTSILLDDTITVIDGGKILTGTVEANALKANSLTLGQISTEAQSSILNSNVQVGSRNLLRKTSTLDVEDCVMARTTVVEPGVFQITPTGSAAYFKFKANYLDYADFGDGKYTLSCEAKLADVETSYTSINLNFFIGYSDAEHYDVAFANNAYHKYVGIGGANASNPVTDSWQRFSVTFNVPEQLTSGSLVLADGVYLSATLYCPGSRKPVLVRHVKLEKGTKATDWTSAPEDTTEAINAVSDEITAATGSLTETVEGLSGSLEDTNGRLSNLTQAVQDADADRAKWIQATDEGLDIGAQQSSYRLHLDNNSVDFLIGDLLAATASADAFIPTALRLGNYVLSGSGDYLYVDYDPINA